MERLGKQLWQLTAECRASLDEFSTYACGATENSWDASDESWDAASPCASHLDEDPSSVATPTPAAPPATAAASPAFKETSTRAIKKQQSDPDDLAPIPPPKIKRLEMSDRMPFEQEEKQRSQHQQLDWTHVSMSSSAFDSSVASWFG